LKHVKRLTRAEKILLSKRKLNSKNFLRLSKDDEKFEFVEVTSGKILTIWR
jgi:hypothetical protein